MTLFLLACAAPLEGDVLVLGDSIFDWNVDRGSIPEVMAEESGLTVASAAVSGAHLSSEAGAEAIVNQYQPGDWQWVVLDGGGNDLNDRCACEPCEVEEELEQTLTEFIASVDSKVLLWGYYEMLFVDGRDVVTADALEYYDDDHVHPSVEGGRVVGRQIAEALQ
jgi:acyl-CoA thioesterase I